MGADQAREWTGYQRKFEELQTQKQLAAINAIETSSQYKTSEADLKAKKEAAQRQRRKEIKELEDQLEDLQSVPSPYTNFVMGVHDADAPSNCSVLNRGELDNKGAEVPRGMLTVLSRGSGGWSHRCVGPCMLNSPAFWRWPS